MAVTFLICLCVSVFNICRSYVLKAFKLVLLLCYPYIQSLYFCLWGGGGDGVGDVYLTYLLLSMTCNKMGISL